MSSPPSSAPSSRSHERHSFTSPEINRRPWIWLPTLLLTATAALYADEVTLDNGQKLLGRITKLDDLDLYLRVHFADASIPIPRKNVTELVTTAPIRIELRKVGEDSETPGFRPSISLRVKLPLDLRIKDSIMFYGNLKTSSD